MPGGEELIGEDGSVVEVEAEGGGLLLLLGVLVRVELQDGLEKVLVTLIILSHHFGEAASEFGPLSFEV